MKPSKIFQSSLWSLALSQAPLIVEGAGHILDLIRGRITLFRDRDRDRDRGDRPVHEMTLAELAREVASLRSHSQAIDDAQLEQIKLMQQVVEQNRMMALALQKFSIRFKIVLGVATVAVLGDLGLLIWALRH